MQLVEIRKEAKVIGMPTSGLMTLIGDTKSGKTTLAASFPDSYLIEMEKGRADRIKNARIHEVDNLNDMGEVIQLAIAAPDIKVIILDSVDQIAKWMSDEIARENGMEFIRAEKGKPDPRTLWQEFGVRVRGLVDYLKSSDKLIIFIAHRRVAKLDDSGRITTPAGINVSGQGGDYIAQQSEMIGFLDVREIGGKSTHFLSFRGESNRAIWRSGIEELHDKEIVITKSDPYGSFADAFKTPAPKTAPQLQPAPTPARKKK